MHWLECSLEKCDRFPFCFFFWPYQQFQDKYPSDHAVAHEGRILIANYVNAVLDRYQGEWLVNSFCI